MRYWTYSEIKTKIEQDLGIEQEEFVKVSELMSYCNEAIDDAEAEIHGLYEDYFLTYSTINLVAGTATYSLPSDIYGNKVRGIMFLNGSTMYPVKRIRYNDKFADIMNTATFNPGDKYRYFVINQSAADGVKIEIVPTPRDSITAGLKVFYLRNANRITADTDVCDIPEFVSFILQFMKMRVYEKEGHPSLAVAARLLKQQRDQMIATLGNMIPDGDNEIEKDLHIYEEMV